MILKSQNPCIEYIGKIGDNYFFFWIATYSESLTTEYYVVKKKKKNLLIGQQWRNRHREKTYRHGERGREDEMYGNSNMETYITICKIDSQWKFAVWLRKLKQGLCINLEG